MATSNKKQNLMTFKGGPKIILGPPLNILETHKDRCHKVYDTGPCEFLEAVPQ